MAKKQTILITGSTDGIGLEAAKLLRAGGHNVLLHGRNDAKVETVRKQLSAIQADGSLESYVADLSKPSQVVRLAEDIAQNHESLDVLVNNAGVLKASNTISPDGLDVRFVVNTIAPYILTKRLLPLMNASGRVVNLSSAAQASVNLEALAGKTSLGDMDAYSQSKLAITMWSFVLAAASADNGPAVIALNPGSLLATKMVKEGMGISGNDINIGADIIVRAAIGDDFANASGKYFDNDSGRFAPPHPDALDSEKSKTVVAAIEQIVTTLC